MARTKAATNFETSNAAIRGAALEPMRVVRRKLVSPSGSVVVVDVPVYPPFRLETKREPPAARAQSADRLRSRQRKSG